MYRVPKDIQTFDIGPNTKPALTVPDGAIVIFDTVDCFSEKVKGADDTFDSFELCSEYVGGLNPINGPVAIENAYPGDFIEIEILSIKTAKTGVSAYIPNLGLFSTEDRFFADLSPDTRICEIIDETVRLPTSKGCFSAVLKPMIGTLWTAPGKNSNKSYIFDSKHMGNVDCTDVTIGSKIRLPVAIEGALIGLGDVHAVQGHGEILGVAVEVSAMVKTRISVIKKEQAMYVECPQVNSDLFIGSVGCSFGMTLGDNIKNAYLDLLLRLVKNSGYSKRDAYHLLGQVGEVNVCQLLGEHQAALVKIHKRYL